MTIEYLRDEIQVALEVRCVDDTDDDFGRR